MPAIAEHTVELKGAKGPGSGQARDYHGRWTSGHGGVSGISSADEARIGDIDKRMAEVHAGSAGDFEEEAKMIEAYNSSRGPQPSYAHFQEVRGRTAQHREEMNSLAAEKMGILHKDEPAIDPEHERWSKVKLEDGVSVQSSETGSQHGFNHMSEKYSKARDRYVAADTPTLEMNEALRGEREMSPGLKRRMNEAHYMTEGVTTKDAVVSRYMGLDPTVAAKMSPGTTWESKGYQSTQAGRLSGYGEARLMENAGTVPVMVTMRIPKGTHAANMEPFSERGGEEIVLRPGRSKIISSNWDGTTLNVTAAFEGDQ